MKFRSYLAVLAALLAFAAAAPSPDISVDDVNPPPVPLKRLEELKGEESVPVQEASIDKVNKDSKDEKTQKPEKPEKLEKIETDVKPIDSPALEEKSKVKEPKKKASVKIDESKITKNVQDQLNARPAKDNAFRVGLVSIEDHEVDGFDPWRAVNPARVPAGHHGVRQQAAGHASHSAHAAHPHRNGVHHQAPRADKRKRPHHQDVNKKKNSNKKRRASPNNNKKKDKKKRPPAQQVAPQKKPVNNKRRGPTPSNHNVNYNHNQKNKKKATPAPIKQQPNKQPNRRNPNNRRKVTTRRPPVRRRKPANRNRPYSPE